MDRAWLILLLRTAIGVVAATGLGWWLGQALGAPWTGLVCGALLAAILQVMRLAWQARRMAQWLQWDAESVPSALAFPAPWQEPAQQARKARQVLWNRHQATLSDHQRFLEAFQSTPNGLLLLNRDDCVLWCNAAACDLLGLDAHRDRLQRLTNLVRHPEFVEFMARPQGRTTVAIPRRTGLGRLSIQSNPVAGEGRLLWVQDVSLQEQAEAMRRDFVAHVSHEVRTPLTVLRGFVETLQSLELEAAERQQVLGLMAQQADRMQALVDDLLTLARLEGSPGPSTGAWHPLQTLLDRVADEARQASKGSHPLTFARGADWDLAGASTELHSALGNLVLNALRYTPAGGAVRVEVVSLDDGGLRLDVIDQGIGIAAEHIPRLTQRFYRVDPSRSRNTGGTGLGLAIVKHAMVRHGGELLIESSPGQGSCFSLRFPAVRVRRRQASLSDAGSA